MEKDTMNEVALVMLVEHNWQQFVEFSGGEESAEMTLRALRQAGGMEAAE